MKCVILAAGYATRMYPLTENFPKPLLEVGGRTIMDRLLDDIETIEQIDECVVVTNHRFIAHFEDWKSRQSDRRFSIDVLDDGSTENDNRLGAVKDLDFAIGECNIDDDVLVLAGDNLLDFSLKGYVEFFVEKNHSSIMYYYEPELDRLRRTGVIDIDGEGKVLSMQEKPQNPVSNYAVPPFYIYAKDDLHWIREAVVSGVNVDAPGNLLSKMCQYCEVYAFNMPGKRIDVGCLADYEKIKDCTNF
ncbi:MAG: nucleotidyltransferase family protein [Lachnospira sp.]|nr:nucleotidyltransferase family protein [Lachnospira sp.]